MYQLLGIPLFVVGTFLLSLGEMKFKQTRVWKGSHLEWDVVFCNKFQHILSKTMDM